MPGKHSSHLKTQLATAVAVLHAALVVFFALGWLLPWRWAWWAVLTGGIVLMVIWRTHENNCPLTTLERRLRGQPAETASPRFVATLIKAVTGVTMSNRTADAIAHIGLITSMIICVLRIAG